MKKSEPDEIQKNTKPCIALQEFCDMEQLYTILDNRSKSTGMSAVIVDAKGTPTSDNFGMTEFCSMIHTNENGRKSCASIWKENYDGIYVCPSDFVIFLSDYSAGRTGFRQGSGRTGAFYGAG